MIENEAILNKNKQNYFKIYSHLIAIGMKNDDHDGKNDNGNNN